MLQHISIINEESQIRSLWGAFANDITIIFLFTSVQLNNYFATPFLEFITANIVWLCMARIRFKFPATLASPGRPPSRLSSPISRWCARSALRE